MLLKEICVFLGVFAILCDPVLSKKKKSKDSDLGRVSIFTLILPNSYSLTLFLTFLHDLDYPKSKLELTFMFAIPDMECKEILHRWLQSYEEEYKKVVVIKLEASRNVNGLSKSFGIINLMRDTYLTLGRQNGNSHAWYLETDVMLTDTGVLRKLIRFDYTLSAPILRTVGMKTNVWLEMDVEDMTEIRDEDYMLMIQRSNHGCFAVPVIEKGALINLKHPQSTHLALNGRNPDDSAYNDTILLSKYAHDNNIEAYACSVKPPHEYGYMVLNDDKNTGLENFINLKVYMIPHLGESVQIDEIFAEYMPSHFQKDEMDLDNIYMVNLDEREAEKEKMEACFEELDIEHERWRMEKLQDLTSSSWKTKGISLLSGENLSLNEEVDKMYNHINIWHDALEKEYHNVMIVEDSIRFEANFRKRIREVLAEADRLDPDWDVLFLGSEKNDSQLSESTMEADLLVEPLQMHPHWSIGYIIKARGMTKLLDQHPMGKLLPLHEFLAVMQDSHIASQELKSHFKNRKLKAYGCHQGLVSFVQEASGNDNPSPTKSHRKDEL